MPLESLLLQWGFLQFFSEKKGWFATEKGLISRMEVGLLITSEEKLRMSFKAVKIVVFGLSDIRFWLFPTSKYRSLSSSNYKNLIAAANEKRNREQGKFIRRNREVLINKIERRKPVKYNKSP